MHPDSAHGNSLVEYTLPIAIVALVVFSLLSQMDLGLTFQSKLTNSQKGTMEGEALNQEIAGHLAPGGLGSKENLRAYYKGNGFTYSEGNTVCLGGQNCMTVPNIADGSVAEVDGGLGGQTTRKLADFLQKIAQQLEEDGADPQLKNLVKDLANKGHQMADGQLGLFEYATTGSESYKNSYKVNGNSNGDPKYTTICPNDDDCSKQRIKTTNTYNQLNINHQEFSSLHQQLKNYLQMHPGALEGLPGAESIINQSADQISQIQQNLSLESSTDSASFNQDGSSKYYNYATNVGHVTRFNANTICTRGEGGDGCHRI